MPQRLEFMKWSPRGQREPGGCPGPQGGQVASPRLAIDRGKNITLKEWWLCNSKSCFAVSLTGK